MSFKFLGLISTLSCQLYLVCSSGNDVLLNGYICKTTYAVKSDSLFSPVHTVPFTAAFNVSLELQGGNCSDQLTLICRHSAVITTPNWIVNGTTNSITGDAIGTAFPETEYTVESLTEHRVTISGVDSVQALDGHFIQCVYDVLGTIVKSNAVQFTFIPPGQCGMQNVPPAIST